MGGSRPDGLKLYNFVDNHDVERIYTKLKNKSHFVPTHILMYTLPGIPSIYYGSEFGIEGAKQYGSDDSLRPALSYQQYAFSRNYYGQSVLVTVNNSDNDCTLNLPAGNCSEYVGSLTGTHIAVNGGYVSVNVRANSGEIWVPADGKEEIIEPVITEEIVKIPEPEKVKKPILSAESSQTIEVSKATIPVQNKSYEEMTVEELQQAILDRMAKNGPVTDRMRQDVIENVYHSSLVTWIRSFN